jgi:hypothetical protein
MAKGQVSEEELTKGLKGIGNFGGISSSPRVRRDNPFRDSRDEPPPAAPAKTIEVVPGAPEKRAVKAVEPKVEPKPVRSIAPAPKAVEKERVGEKTAPAVRKADIFTERVTLQISPEMRDEVERLARELQRSKTSKGERITANTVMRVALQLLMKNYQFGRGDVANNEGELYDLVLQRFRRK